MVITNVDAFKASLQSAVRREKLGLRAQLVRLRRLAAVRGRVPPDVRGFVKNGADRTDEREYRVAIDARQVCPIRITSDAGELSDISIIIPLKGDAGVPVTSRWGRKRPGVARRPCSADAGHRGGDKDRGGANEPPRRAPPAGGRGLLARSRRMLAW